jgi:hypothetical protein
MRRFGNVLALRSVDRARALGNCRLADIAITEVCEPVYYGPDVDAALDWVRGFTCGYVGGAEVFRGCVVFGGAAIVLLVRTIVGRGGGEGAMPDEDSKRAAHRALVERVLSGDGTASAEQRARAFGNEGLSPPLDALVGKVVDRPSEVSEADLALVTAAGYSEDQVFELVVCAAVGQSERLYAAGLAALAEATAGEGPGHAS